MSILDDILNQLYRDAGFRNKVPMKRRLGSGLHVSITSDNGRYTLAIARDKTYPSRAEWKTICDHFPYHIGTPEPTLFTDGDRRFAMRAEIPKRHAVQESLL